MAAGLTTTTTLTEWVNSEFINPTIMDYAHDFVVAAPYCAVLDLRGRATNQGAFTRMILDTASDIANESTTLTNEDFESSEVTITGAEVGVRRDVTDAALEQTIVGSQIFDILVRDSGILLGISLDDDICALFSSLNSGTAVGTSGNNLTLANMVEAQAQIRINGQRGSLVYVLDDQQASDLQAAQAAATSTTVDSFFTVSTGIDNGYLGTFMGAPVWQTGLCDSANTNADKVGACYIDGAASPRTAAIGMVLVRDVRTELERDASERLTEFVATAKWGVGEISDTSGVPIVTDA